MDTKAFMLVSYYELKVKLEMTTPEEAPVQGQTLFLTPIPCFHGLQSSQSPDSSFSFTTLTVCI